MTNESIIGRRFGKLTVLQALDERTLNRHIKWLCRCDCGKEIVVGSKYHLTSGNTQSCGCLRRATMKAKQQKHGGKGTRLYNIWKGARQRCRNPKATDYDLYGGRGITFTKVWDDFDAFRSWALANGYRDDLTLDRIDPDGNYCPQNCRWVSWKEQRHNQRRCKEVVP